MPTFDFGKAERLTVHTQTKLTPSERQRLTQILDRLQAEGTDITLSALVRVFLVAGMEQYEAQNPRP